MQSDGTGARELAKRTKGDARTRTQIASAVTGEPVSGSGVEPGRMPMARIAELRVGGKVTLASRPIVRRLRARALPLVEGSPAPERGAHAVAAAARVAGGLSGTTTQSLLSISGLVSYGACAYVHSLLFVVSIVAPSPGGTGTTDQEDASDRGCFVGPLPVP